MPVPLNDAVRKLLDDPNPAVLATINPDGSPQTSVIWVGRDGDKVVISTAAGRRKDRNIRRDPRVSLSVYDQADPEQYAEIRGTATVTEDPGRALAVELGEKYDGPGGGQPFLDLPPEIVRVVIRITPEHVAGRAAG
ncbi:MAG TPA: PPOX class F420-dependent oxidoreductase [Streptosporangiaceae bacterium]|nr:PPOX class F420-dependent oxidoreductase [Streptosporangiaceae bacterium]